MFLHAIIEGNPTFEELRRLSWELNEWKWLGRFLGFKESELTGIDKDNADEHFEKVYAMLRKWKERGGTSATYIVLHEALCRANLRNLAQEYCGPI